MHLARDKEMKFIRTRIAVPTGPDTLPLPQGAASFSPGWEETSYPGLKDTIPLGLESPN